ncbi:hypothetical protein N7539_004084 [Penicillium diatomitis]|uniref:Uncharacterized protein n=1 Tax=Penicillium diatomitis TaxID=2819901 RepID=A0A9X0BY63_9EURO|nr:uncharacterized protein N7539_004084 [Penicillium diatomitis]KAJ5489194.1 hypothetical protein N7539_004084 [Penicillium diatomitis]
MYQIHEKDKQVVDGAAGSWQQAAQKPFSKSWLGRGATSTETGCRLPLSQMRLGVENLGHPSHFQPGRGEAEKEEDWT